MSNFHVTFQINFVINFIIESIHDVTKYKSTIYIFFSSVNGGKRYHATDGPGLKIMQVFPPPPESTENEKLLLFLYCFLLFFVSKSLCILKMIVIKGIKFNTLKCFLIQRIESLPLTLTHSYPYFCNLVV